MWLEFFSCHVLWWEEFGQGKIIKPICRTSSDQNFPYVHRCYFKKKKKKKPEWTFDLLKKRYLNFSKLFLKNKQEVSNMLL